MKIAALVMCLTFILHLVSMGAAHWAKSDDTVQRREHIGLWRFCTETIGGGTKCDRFIDIIVGDWLRSAQGFSILALFAMIGATVLVAMLTFVPDYSDDTRMLMIGIAVTGVAALFKLIEVGIMGATYQEYFKNKDPASWGYVGQLDWAFGVAVASMVLNFATVILMVLEMAQGGKNAY